VRRNGFVTLMKDGTPVPGPFTLEAREEILVRLLSVQAEVGVELISSSELSHIKRLWAADAAAEARRSLEALQELGLAAPRSTHR
jgi:DNA sulfur modification protein DndC